MLPVGPLMIEHRLIERVIKLWKLQLEDIDKKQTVDISFIDTAADFMKTYADRCHHGKEEDILFRDLEKKPLVAGHKKILQELIDEHTVSRRNLKVLLEAKGRYAVQKKEALNDIKEAIKTLTVLYPRHIEKEDKHFFLPCMKYFTKLEQENMLQEFKKFDANLIHEKYKLLVERLEK